jgi:phage terminase large subunit
MSVITWRPQDKPDGSAGPQELVLRSSCYEIGNGGARGGGKTDGMIQWMQRPAISGESYASKYQGLLLRKNATDLKSYLSRASRFYFAMGAKKKGNPPVFTFPDGGQITHDHLANKDAFQKYQGNEYHRIGIEELTQIPEESQYIMIMGSCRSTVPGLRPQILSNFNPGGPGHSWVRKRFIDSAPPNVIHRGEHGRSTVFIPARLEDNPILMRLDPGYEKFLNSLPEKLRMAWRLGDWNCLEGSYFPEFSKDIHTCAAFDIPPHWNRYRALDWGYWPDPWVCLWFASDEDGRQYLYREAMGFRMIPSKVAEEVMRLSAGESFDTPVLCDPSIYAHKDGVSTAEKFLQAGLVVTGADNSRVAGWTRVHEYLYYDDDCQPMFQIFDTCLKSIETLPLMIHSDRNPMDCLKNSQIDHHPDTIRYHLMGRPQITLKLKKIIPWNALSEMRKRKILGYGGPIYGSD